jgi:hypothetical protein
MSNYHTPREFQDAAKSLDTSPAELRELAKASWDFVRVAVAGNPNTDTDVLLTLIPRKFISWNDQLFAVALVQNPNSSEEVLEILAQRLAPVLDNGRNHQVGFEAGVLLCSHPTVSIKLITSMLYSEHVAMQFRKVVARETQRRDVLEILLVDRSETVRRHAQRRIQADDTGITK